MSIGLFDPVSTIPWDLITWCIITLIFGFIVGLLVGLFFADTVKKEMQKIFGTKQKQHRY
jgi:multisubunit Na+/H+ antiporter MnhE subunit